MSAVYYMPACRCICPTRSPIMQSVGLLFSFAQCHSGEEIPTTSYIAIRHSFGQGTCV